MKSKTKSKLLIVCAILLVGIAIVGTIAYLTKTSGPVTNTFVAGDIFENDDPSDPAFVLKEHKVAEGTIDNEGNLTNGATGVYYYVKKSDETKTTKVVSEMKEVDNNSYNHVLPGVDLDKDPFVKTTKPTKIDTYLFIEVVNTLPNTMTVTIDSEKWEKVTLDLGKQAKNEGDVYVLKKNSDNVIPAGTTISATNILKDNKIQVSDAPISITDSTNSLTFYGYMIQKGNFTDAKTAFQSAFLKTN